MTTPPFFVRMKLQLTPEEYYEKSLASAKRCCPQLNEDGDISECSCPLARGKFGKKGKAKFLRKETKWCQEMIDADCIPQDL
eukprot:Awhi_evm1s8992